MEIWLEFRRAHAKVLEFAERNAGFKRLLDTIRPADLPRLDEVVATGSGQRGRGRRAPAPRRRHAESGGLGAAAGGARHRPRGALAGDGAQVVGRRRRQPAQGGRIRRSIAARRPTRSPRPGCSGCSDSKTGWRSRGWRPCSRPRATSLFELDGAALVRLARSLDEPQLESLVALPDRHWRRDPRSAILSVVAQAPARMAELASPRVRDGDHRQPRPGRGCRHDAAGGISCPIPGVLMARTPGWCWTGA